MNCVRMLIDKRFNFSSSSIIGLLATCILTGCTAYLLAVLIERPCIRFGRRWTEQLRLRRSDPRPFNHAPLTNLLKPILRRGRRGASLPLSRQEEKV